MRLAVFTLLSLVLLASPSLAYELHEGDFVVGSGETFVLKDRTLEVDGDFILEDGSTFIMENAVLIIRERYKSEHSLKATRAKITVRNSQIRSSQNVMAQTLGNLLGPELNLHMDRRSEITVEGSEIYGRIILHEASTGHIENSTVSYVYWSMDSKLTLEKSVLGSFVFECFGGKRGEMTLSDLKRNASTNLELSNLPEGGFLEMRDTNVKMLWSFNMEAECEKDVTLRNSNFNLFWVKFPPTDERIRIENLPTGFVTSFDLREVVSGITLPYNVRIENARIDFFKPEMLGTKAEIVNSHAMVHPYDFADLVIRNSTLYSFFNYGSKRVEFHNVYIRENLQLIEKVEFRGGGRKVNGKTIGAGGNFDFLFDNLVINAPEIIVACNEGKMNGSVKFLSPLSLSNVHWVKGKITRTYPVISDPNAKITLWDGETLKQTKTTDENGRTSFTLIFDPTTYNKTYTLKLSNSSFEFPLTFITSTPINLTAPKPEPEEPPEQPGQAEMGNKSNTPPASATTPEPEGSESPPPPTPTPIPVILGVLGIFAILIAIGVWVVWRKR
ncbi:MAG: hypothetical protein J7K72_00935 [Candidatus Aenigmarchaeota archaeon]|nr:hypothetical protein [Candidatus Aenigmarchaeota archaeon]